MFAGVLWVTAKEGKRSDSFWGDVVTEWGMRRVLGNVLNFDLGTNYTSVCTFWKYIEL